MVVMTIAMVTVAIRFRRWLVRVKRELRHRVSSFRDASYWSIRSPYFSQTILSWAGWYNCLKNVNIPILKSVALERMLPWQDNVCRQKPDNPLINPTKRNLSYLPPRQCVASNLFENRMKYLPKSIFQQLVRGLCNLITWPTSKSDSETKPNH